MGFLRWGGFLPQAFSGIFLGAGVNTFFFFVWRPFSASFSDLIPAPTRDFLFLFPAVATALFSPQTFAWSSFFSCLTGGRFFFGTWGAGLGSPFPGQVPRFALIAVRHLFPQNRPLDSLLAFPSMTFFFPLVGSRVTPPLCRKRS